MSVSASMVRDLREKTNAGMLDCKKALEETKGDIDAAVEWLRKKGLASAAKKADRLASEGLVVSFVQNGKSGVLLEVNSETDFVAKNENFVALVNQIAKFIATSPTAPADIETLLNSNLNNTTISELMKESIAKIGENLVLRRFVRFDAPGYVHSYIHGDGKIGVLVELTTAQVDDAAKTAANDVCLHIAAMNPLALSKDEIPAEIVSKEKEILRAKAIESGKKPEMLDKIVEGQINKFLSESALLEQAFVKNPDQKVREYVAEQAKKSAQTFTVKRFTRFELGAGLQKKSNNFAEEVAAQMKGH